MPVDKNHLPTIETEWLVNGYMKRLAESRHAEMEACLDRWKSHNGISGLIPEKLMAWLKGEYCYRVGCHLCSFWHNAEGIAGVFSVEFYHLPEAGTAARAEYDALKRRERAMLKRPN